LHSSSISQNGKKIFILLSIKTRIETDWWIEDTYLIIPIFILLSIKTRIETHFQPVSWALILPFLSYYPLKQGLKQKYTLQEES